MQETIDWYLHHRDWWEAVRSGAYRDYYDRQYGARLGEGAGESRPGQTGPRQGARI